MYSRIAGGGESQGENQVDGRGRRRGIEKGNRASWLRGLCGRINGRGNGTYAREAIERQCDEMLAPVRMERQGTSTEVEAPELGLGGA